MIVSAIIKQGVDWSCFWRTSIHASIRNYMNISTFADERVDTNFDEKIFFEAYLKGRASQYLSITK